MGTDPPACCTCGVTCRRQGVSLQPLIEKEAPMHHMPTPGQTEGRHLADHRAPSSGARTARFLHLARAPREMFHVKRPAPGSARLKAFLSIARGRSA